MALNLETRFVLDEAAIKSPNLAGKFSDKDLTSIANYCLEGYKADVQSRSSWFKRTGAAMDLAMQVVKEKSFPWAGASNIVFPLVTVAALQFHARAYPAIVSGSQVVKCRLSLPSDAEHVARANTVGRYMSYQVLEEDTGWEEGQDRMLLQVPIVGCAFKKSFYDAALGHNISTLIAAKNFVVDYYARSVDSARRKTEQLPLHRNKIWELCAAGTYVDVREKPWFLEPAKRMPEEVDSGLDKRTGMAEPQADESTPFLGLEQHCWLDLDGDGYEEPYVVTLEEGSGALLRLVSRCSRGEDVLRDGRGRVIRIQAEEYYTKFGFIPSPDGGIYDIGFGTLIGPLNESSNTLINQLVDTGTMVNTAGGFLARGVKVRGGTYGFSPLEWKRVDSTGDDLRKGIVPLPVREPSEVLFKLLGLLIEYTNRISGATETLAGENPGQNTKVGTANQMVEQGLKVYAAIFKRIWRSQKEEFKKLYILNGRHLPMNRRTWNGFVVKREDYLDNPNLIVPTADPNIVSDQTRIGLATMIAERSRIVPGYDPEAAEKNLLEAYRVDAPERFYVGVQKTGPLPNPKMMVEQEKTKREQMKLKHAAEMFVLEIQEQHALNEAKIEELAAMSTKLLAEAKGVDVTLQINAINATVGALKQHNEVLNTRAKTILEAMTHEQGDHSGAISHLVGGPGNQGGSGPLPANAGGGQGGLGARGTGP